MLELLLAFPSHTASLSDELAREVGRTVAHATLAIGRPSGFYDMADGRRAYQWHKAAWAGGAGPRCSYTVYAENYGQPHALAAWNIVAIEPSAPGC